MKKLLLGAIVLFLFAASISVVEISCQKIHAQARPQSPAGAGTVLFTKQTILSIIPPVSTVVTDSTGTHTIITPGDTSYTSTLFICNIDGSNVRQIPLPQIGNLYIDPDYAKLTSNGDSIVIGAYALYKTFSTSAGLYTCAIDGSGLKQIVPQVVYGEGYKLVDVK